MSDIRAFVKNTSVGRAGDGTLAGVRMTPDGALYVAQYPLSASIEGRLFGCHWGTVTTPLATAATTAIVAARPMAWIRVPDGTTIFPLNLEITMEATGITTQGEISVAIAQNDVGNGTSTAGTSGIIALNTAALVTSNCSHRHLATADVTAETSLLELKRFSFAASAVNQAYSWNAAREGIWPVLRGPASLLVYIGGNAVNFFAQAQFIEVTEASVS